MCLAVPGKIVHIEDSSDETLRLAKVDFGGTRKDVNLAFTPEAVLGDYVLVHVGFALNTVDEEEAQRIFEDLKRLGDIEEELGAGTGENS
jgi:hydrogenase expression/formation protein HypC